MLQTKPLMPGLLLQDIKAFIETDPYYKAGLISSWCGLACHFLLSGCWCVCSTCF